MWPSILSSNCQKNYSVGFQYAQGDRTLGVQIHSLTMQEKPEECTLIIMLVACGYAGGFIGCITYIGLR